MEQNFNRRIETDLDLNGPHLAISSQPSDATVANGASQTFSVTASATFPGNTGADDEGTLTYQWYLNTDTKLTNDGRYSGTTTATLTVSNIESPENNGDKYYCVIDYTPAEKYAEDGKSTGHPINGAITSDSATLTVTPYLVIGSQPSSVDRVYDVYGEISVSASLSDNSYSNDIGYQWYLNGSPVSDGTKTSTRIERGTVTEVIERESEEVYYVVKRYTYSYNQTYYHSSSAQTHKIPGTASNIKVTIAGAGGGKGGEDAPWNCAGDGGSGRKAEFILETDDFRGTTITMYAGKKGSDGTHGQGSAGGAGGGYGGFAGGGNGGGAGGSGGSGGGGGGGGASALYHGSYEYPVIVAGGGGGGGGCSNYNHGGRESQYGGRHAKNWEKKNAGAGGGGNGGVFRPDGGHGGGPCYCSDGAGGGGAGAGAVEDTPPPTEVVTFNVQQNAGASNKIYLQMPTTHEVVYTFDSTKTGNKNVALTVGQEYDLTTWSSCGLAYIEAQDGGKRVGLDDCKPGGDNDYNDLTVSASSGEFYGTYRGGSGKFKISSASGQIGGASRGGTGGCDGQRGGESGEGGKSFWHSGWVRGMRADGTPNNYGNTGQGFIKLTYSWYEDVNQLKRRTVVNYEEVEKEIENSIPQNLTIEGTQGSTIKLKADYNTAETLKCVVSSPQSSNSPLTTDEVEFSSFNTLAEKTLYMEQAFWNFDKWRGGYANGVMRVASSSSNLANGEVTIGYDDGTAYESVDATDMYTDDLVRGKGINIFTSFYVTTDTEVEIDLYGGKGVEWTSLTNGANTTTGLQPGGPYPYDPNGYTALAAQHSPGNGGYGRIRFTMKANREYTVAGMFSTINTPYLYELNEVIAVVGQGGGNNVYGGGANGGGLRKDGDSVTISGTQGSTGGVLYHGTNENFINSSLSLIKQARLGSAYYPYRRFWDSPGEMNSMLTYIAANGDSAALPIIGEGSGKVKKYSVSINNTSNISTRKMLVRDMHGNGSGVGSGPNGEGDFIDNTATIERGFWDIDYAFLGTAGGRANGNPSFEPKDFYKVVERQNSLNQMAMNNAKGLYDLNCVGGNGAAGGMGGVNGNGGGGGAGFLARDKDITLVSTSSGGSTGNSKIVIRLATQKLYK